MPHNAHRIQASKQRFHSPTRLTRRQVLLVWMLVPLLLIAVVSAVIYARTQGQSVPSKASSSAMHTHTAPTKPADRFMQSIVTEDGALGWRQLCPSIHAQLPQDELVQQANAERAAAARQGVWLTMEFKGTHARQGGGELRVYLVTAHWPNGTTQQRTFNVFTQASGCVEDVQNS